MAAARGPVAVADLPGAPEFEAAIQKKLQVVELYSEWAGPTAACKSTWRKLALEHGGALPFEVSTACIERCRGAPALAGHPAVAASSSEPQFLLFKAGKEVTHIVGVNLPELVKALAKHSSEGGGGAAVQRLESEA